MSSVNFINGISSTTSTSTPSFSLTVESKNYTRYLLIVYASIYGSGSSNVSNVSVNGNPGTLIYSDTPNSNMPVAVATAEIPPLTTSLSIILTHSSPIVRCVATFYELEEIDVSNISYVVTTTVTSGSLSNSISSPSPYHTLGMVRTRVTSGTATFSDLTFSRSQTTTNCSMNTALKTVSTGTTTDSTTPNSTSNAFYILLALPEHEQSLNPAIGRRRIL